MIGHHDVRTPLRYPRELGDAARKSVTRVTEQHRELATYACKADHELIESSVVALNPWEKEQGFPTDSGRPQKF